MKRIVIIACLLLATVAVKAHNEGKGMKFFKGTYEELLAEAKKQDKKIFIDFYTKWCGPCRAISKNVFPLESVGKFYNEHFINYKVDAEVGEGPELAKKYNVKGFPTFTFTDAEGKSIYEGSSIGAGDEAGFLRLGRLALGLEKKDWAWYQDEYKKGNRKTVFLEEYFNARMAAKSMPPSEEDVFMLYESYPESERWSGKPLNIAFWRAKYGSKFYPIVVANKDKFPLLKDGKSMASWFCKNFYDLMSDEEKLSKTYNAMKADFPTFAKQGMDLFQADRLRFEAKQTEHVVAMMKYVEKYGEPIEFGFMVGSSALQAKELKAEHADYIRKVYKEGLNADPVHFHSVGGYIYLTYKAGKVEEAKETAKKFEKEAEKYKTSRKSAWAYGVVQSLLKGEAPVAFSYPKRK
jgi:thiol-disulfide isomerase/thioredoxin